MNHYHQRTGVAGSGADTECQPLWKGKLQEDEDMELDLASAVRIPNVCCWLRQE